VVKRSNSSLKRVTPFEHLLTGGMKDRNDSANLGAEVVFGGVLDMESVRSALRGIYGAYFVYPIRPGIVDASVRFAQAAKEAGVEIIVNMSQKSAPGDSQSHAALAHWLSERVFDWSGVPVSHIRPTLFLEWILYGAAMIRQGTWLVPFGTGRHAPNRHALNHHVFIGVCWGGRRGLNPRHSVPQTDALPAELLPPLRVV
jgi:hypothetical protein